MNGAKKNTGTTSNIHAVHRHTTDHEGCRRRFSKDSRLKINTLTECCRLKRNKHPKPKIFYFVNASLLPKVPPKMRLPKLV